MQKKRSNSSKSLEVLQVPHGALSCLEGPDGQAHTSGTARRCPRVPSSQGGAGWHAVPTEPPDALMLPLESTSMATALCIVRE